MYKKSTLIIAIVILLFMTGFGISVGVQNFKKYDEQNEKMQNEIKEERSVNDAETNIKPTFIYFVSETDKEYIKAMEVFEKLKEQYEEKVNFSLKNITKNPELLESFSLAKDNTPMLIMDGEEGFTGIKFKTSDIEILEAEIKKALSE